MGLYATTTSFTELLVRFYKNNTTSSDTTGVAIAVKHIDRAEGTVNAALTRRYAIPFATVPPEVRRISEDIATYYLIRACNYQDGKTTKHAYLEEFKTAFDDLKNIADGKSRLSLTDGSLLPIKASSRILSSTEDYTPIFGLDPAKNWERDPDEIDDQENSRE